MLFRSFSGARATKLHVLADGERRVAEIVWREGEPVALVDGAQSGARGDAGRWRGDDPGSIAVDADGEALVVRGGRQIAIRALDTLRDAAAGGDTNGGAIRSPMHGKLVSLSVGAGERVHKGQKLAIVEAMKMEHALTAPFDGRVAEVQARPGEIGRAHG